MVEAKGLSVTCVKSRERDIYVTPARPGYGHMAVASCCYVYKASIFWPVMAFLSMVQNIINVHGLIIAQSACMNEILFCYPLLLCEI